MALAALVVLVGGVWAAGRWLVPGTAGGAAGAAATRSVMRNGKAAAFGAVGAPLERGGMVHAPAFQSGATVAAGPAMSVTSGGGASVLGRRIVETATITVAVPHPRTAFAQVGAEAVALGGYIQNSSLMTGGKSGDISASLVLEVPHAQYGALLKHVSGMGRVRSSSAGSQDVTAQYVDLQGRIRALTAERQSYLTLLGHATKVGDILQIQSALTGVEAQLEGLTGELRVLAHQSAMATVSVTLLPMGAAAPIRVVRPLGPVIKAFSASLRAMGRGGLAAAEVLAWLVPWALIGLGGYAGYRLLARRRARA